MDNQCVNCQFFRSPDFYDPYEIGDNWCSNLKSVKFRHSVKHNDTCEAFLSKEAQGWMITLEKLLRNARNDR